MLWENRHKAPQSMGRRIPVADPAAGDGRADQTRPSSGKPPRTPRPSGTIRNAWARKLSVVNWKMVTVISVFVLLIGGGIVLGGYMNSMTTIRDVVVSGVVFTSEKAILEAAQISHGTHVDSIQFLPAIARLERLPYVNKAGIRVSATGRMTISVTEREPIGLFMQGSRRFYIDAQGVKLPITPGKSINVPLVYGIPIGGLRDTLKSAEFLLLRDFLVTARQYPVAAHTLSEVAWTTNEGIIALSSENGIKVIFGSDRFPNGLRNWDMFYTQVVSRRGPDQFTQIDLRYQGQVVTRETKSS